MTVYLKKVKNSTDSCYSDNMKKCYYFGENGCTADEDVLSCKGFVFIEVRKKVYLKKVKIEKRGCADKNKNLCYFFNKKCDKYHCMDKDERYNIVQSYIYIEVKKCQNQ